MPSCCQGPAHLGRVVLVDLAAGLRRVPVVRRPVGIERAEQALGGDHFRNRPERAHGAFLLDEKARVDLARRVVQRDHQVPDLIRHPFMAGGVLVQHHAHHRPPWPLAPVRPAPGRRPDPPARLKRETDPVVAALETVIGHQLLPEVPGREIPVVRVEQRQDRHHLVNPSTPGRGPPQATVVQTLSTFRLIAIPPAPEGPLRDPQNLRRLLLAQLAAITPSVNVLELHQPQSL